MKSLKFLLIIVLVLPLTLHSQRRKKKTNTLVITVQDSIFHGLKWRNIGPFRGGRCVASSGVVGQPMTYYMGNTGGGIWKTVDDGITWKNISDGFLKTGTVGDISVSESNPYIVVVGMGEHAARGVMTSMGDGVNKSTDGGSIWGKMKEGLPKELGKSGISVSGANPELVFAVIEAEGDKGCVYRSDDAGKKWTQINKDRINIARSWYHMEIFADSQDENLVYVLNAPVTKSIDGGKTFKPLPTPHGDNHDLWINPNDNSKMINSNDGGANVSNNGGKSWSSQQSQPTSQFYRVITDNLVPYNVCGGQQDNSAITNKKTKDFKSWPGGRSKPQVLPSKKGYNRFTWDFNKETRPAVDKVFVYGSYEGSRVGPGTYVLRLTLDSLTSDTEVKILPNPKVQGSMVEYEEQRSILNQIEGVIKNIHESVTSMPSAKSQLENYAKLLEENDTAKDVLEKGKSLIECTDTWEQNLIQPKQKTFQDVINFNNQLNAEFMELKSYVDAAEPKVTQGAKERLKDLMADWNTYETERDAIVDKEMQAYNTMFKELALPAIILEE